MSSKTIIQWYQVHVPPRHLQLEATAHSDLIKLSGWHMRRCAYVIVEAPICLCSAFVFFCRGISVKRHQSVIYALANPSLVCYLSFIFFLSALFRFVQCVYSVAWFKIIWYASSHYHSACRLVSWSRRLYQFMWMLFISVNGVYR